MKKPPVPSDNDTQKTQPLDNRELREADGLDDVAADGSVSDPSNGSANAFESTENVREDEDSDEDNDDFARDFK